MDKLNALYADVFLAKPKSLDRQGVDLFLAIPLYKSKISHRPIYINCDLFYKLTGVKELLSWDEMADVLEHYFSTTIEPDNGTNEVIGRAYVDYQADPLDLSLSGNLGSGRAYYMGQYFNVKGEKTPLAKSEKRQYSDGLLEMERCIWETVVANTLQGSMTTGLSSVLAIMDMGETCDVEWRKKPVRRGKIIRVDEAGELDRVSHVFYNKPERTMNKEALNLCAKNFGILEGGKFTDRIEHGTWSAGNISPKGHLIDFDTVAAVKGRGPLYSSTKWHYENRFGYEYYGQLKVLESLANDHDINSDNVSFQDLETTLLSTRQMTIEKNFLKLMGFSAIDTLYVDYADELSELVELFTLLSAKVFKKPEFLSMKEALSSVVHVFDFSLFFRFYPLLKRGDNFDVPEALRILCQGELLDDPLTEKEETHTDVEWNYLNAVYDKIGDCFVTSSTEFQMLQIAMMSFVKKYDRLYGKILAETNEDSLKSELSAYIINEDRIYLSPYFTQTYYLAEEANDLEPFVTHQMIEKLILSNNRVTERKDGEYITDIRLYEQGCLYNIIDGMGGYQIAVSLFDKKLEEKMLKSDNLELSIKGEKIELKPSGDGEKRCFVSEKYDVLDLAHDIHRENTLHTCNTAIYTHGEYIEWIRLIKN